MTVEAHIFNIIHSLIFT